MSGIDNLYFIRELDEYVLKEYITAEERNELKEAFMNLDKSLQESNELESNLRYMQVTILSETKTIGNTLERKKEEYKLKTDTIESQRTQYKEKEFQLDNIDTQILLMGHEIITKEGERNRLQQELEERKQQEQDMVQPRINELSSDIEMYTSDISNKGKRLESCKTERTKLTENIESLKEEIYKLDKEVEELTKDANEKKSDPAS